VHLINHPKVMELCPTIGLSQALFAMERKGFVSKHQRVNHMLSTPLNDIAEHTYHAPSRLFLWPIPRPGFASLMGHYFGLQLARDDYTCLCLLPWMTSISVQLLWFFASQLSTTSLCCRDTLNGYQPHQSAGCPFHIKRLSKTKRSAKNRIAQILNRTTGWRRLK
jgi:hypothetical protein